MLSAWTISPVSAAPAVGADVQRLERRALCRLAQGEDARVVGVVGEEREVVLLDVDGEERQARGLGPRVDRQAVRSIPPGDRQGDVAVARELDGISVRRRRRDARLVEGVVQPPP
jgi:hypothetical protein